MLKPKVLIIGREDFQETFPNQCFPECSISRCLSMAKIKTLCAGRDFILVEERHGNMLAEIFYANRKYQDDRVLVTRKALNPFQDRRNHRKTDKVLIEIHAETKICFLWNSAFEKSYRMNNGSTGYFTSVEIYQKALMKIIPHEQKTPV